jgi:hypothetical protein
MTTTFNMRPSEVVMSSAFQEFSRTYEQFKKEFPRHPLREELRNRLASGKFPTDPWLRAQTDKMKNLLAPIWLRAANSTASSASSPESPEAAA